MTFGVMAGRATNALFGASVSGGGFKRMSSRIGSWTDGDLIPWAAGITRACMLPFLLLRLVHACARALKEEDNEALHSARRPACCAGT